MASNSSQGLDPSDAAGVEHDLDDEPLNGSWVAEYEDAKVALTKALGEVEEEDRGSGGAAIDNSNNAESSEEAAVLRAYLRLCRAYSKLRRWDKLLIVSQKGLNYARGLSSTGPPRAASSSFREYRKLARAELAVPTKLPLKEFRENMVRPVIEGGMHPDCLMTSGFANANMLQVSVVMGDTRNTERLVALGARIDLPILEPFDDYKTNGQELHCAFPPGATALLVACAVLAAPESNDPYWVSSRASITDPVSDNGHLDHVAECAMLLVHLGADPHLKMPDGLGQDYAMWKPFQGKTALQIAAISKRRPLVALMWEHMQLSPERRAEVVYCRCGSRLPWRQCHATGVGCPSHYLIDAETQETCYRASPLGRCLCRRAGKKYYRCCWGDNRTPMYVRDKTRSSLWDNVDRALCLPSFGRHLHELAANDPAAASALRKYEEGDDWFRPCALLYPKFPSLFAAFCQDLGPKSSMTSWDPQVYAACVERLEVPFLWRDVHWDLDKAILLWRCSEWNTALHGYCGEVGLEGEERERVVSTHTASPCGPCGYIGCEAFESKVREFERCARCQTVAYCRRKCQKKDWTEHQKVCQASSVHLTRWKPFDSL